MTILEKYIANLATIKRTGMAVHETSYYGTLEAFLNEIGSTLRPFVRAVINTKNMGAGIPDGGLFTKEQFSKQKDNVDSLLGTLPARGAIEIKGTSANIEKIATSGQAKKYLKRYGQLLVTNYYQFVLVVLSENGEPKLLERYYLAQDEKDFWNQAKYEKNLAEKHDEGLTQFICRAMLHAAPLLDPKDVAWFLASYARDARNRIEFLELPALEDVKKALEESLGVSFSGKKGEHFFKSTLIQTIFYGVFSSWVLFNKNTNENGNKFDWRLAGWYLKVPMIKALFTRVANPSQLGRLGLIEVLDWAADTLNRIEREEFFSRFEESEAVLYFYEPFLEAFDQELRKEFGVWYTPNEIVTYMVEKVDRALRQELNIKRGLADENVYILDPCCGTGAYLVEVIKRIHKTHQEEGTDALGADDLKDAVAKRIFGFEILPAPFVIAHLQLGLVLENLGAHFITESERPGVYLTNALTGWEAAAEMGKQLIAFPELQEEKDAAEKVKRDKPILVILGNPPYDGFAGIATQEESDLVQPYKDGLISEWGIKKFNLDELYVRFLRIAERKIIEQGEGIACFVSSFTYLYKESFVVLRKQFVNNFSSIYIDSLNGDSRETGKVSPDGTPDPSVFSTDYNKAGIRVGTSVGLFVKRRTQQQQANVHFREFWGTNKKSLLLNSLDADNGLGVYETKSPSKENLFSFRYTASTSDYDKWISFDELSLLPPYQGLDEDRKFDLISFEKDLLSERMEKYYDPSNHLADLKEHLPGLTSESAGFNPVAARAKILKEDKYERSNLLGYTFRAFDERTCYYSTVNPLWKRPRPELYTQLFEGNKFILCRKSSTADPEGFPFFFTETLFARDAIKGHAVAIPFKVTDTGESKGTGSLFEYSVRNNISESVSNYLELINESDASKVWMHVMSIGFSPDYLKEHEMKIKIAYPRIPFPATRELLDQSANLGVKISNLLNLNSKLTDELKPFHLIAVISSQKPGSTNIDLELTAGWGNKTVQGVMPGKGKVVERNYSQEEYKHLDTFGYNKELVHQLLGDKTLDIYFNANTYWKNIPKNVWELHIGGYQVIKKWLSYRESSIIHRSLKKEEARSITEVARRLCGILIMGPDLNANYSTVAAKNYSDWTK